MAGRGIAIDTSYWVTQKLPQIYTVDGMQLSMHLPISVYKKFIEIEIENEYERITPGS